MFGQSLGSVWNIFGKLSRRFCHQATLRGLNGSQGQEATVAAHGSMAGASHKPESSSSRVQKRCWKVAEAMKQQLPRLGALQRPRKAEKSEVPKPGSSEAFSLSLSLSLSIYVIYN